MDIVASYPGGCDPIWVDVCIRCPHASRYTQASRQAGAAAESGTRDKTRRYGDCVLAVSLESYGRIGASAEDAISEIVSRAALTQTMRRDATRQLQSLKAQLQRAVIWATADVDLLCMGVAIPKP
eukprot:10192060-Karenia_brevis.AAC.1